MTFDEAMQEMTDAILEVELTIRDRFTPIIRVTAHALHSEVMYPMWPWWRKWWHIVRGCEWGDR